MPFMLPATPAHARSIAGVAPDVLDSLTGVGRFGSARSAVIIVIDGLGALQLRAHLGHARRLGSLMRKKDVARAVFPSTTAAGLTSILTGTEPGSHGLVGYSVREPSTGVISNQLTGWEKDGLDPETWQRSRTLFEEASDRGLSGFAVGPAGFARTGFTHAVMRGSTYVPAGDIRDRVHRAMDLAERTDGAIIYCYIPEVDKAGHRYGVGSPEWLTALEDVDAAMPTTAPDGMGIVITADHGMINVPATRHVLLGDDDPRWLGVAAVGGEPRMLHVYVEPDADAERIAETWQADAGPSADVITRDEAIAVGLFGPVDPAVESRIGDVLVITRGNWAYYDARTGTDPRSQGMIGQHGSVTVDETIVPLLRTGAFD